MKIVYFQSEILGQVHIFVSKMGKLNGTVCNTSFKKCTVRWVLIRLSNRSIKEMFVPFLKIFYYFILVKVIWLFSKRNFGIGDEINFK